MRTKAPRFLIATLTVTLVSLAGFSAPAEAAKPAQQMQRTVWCC